MYEEYLTNNLNEGFGNKFKCISNCLDIVRNNSDSPVIDALLLGQFVLLKPIRIKLHGICGSKCHYLDALITKDKQKIQKMKSSYEKACKDALDYINKIKDPKKRNHFIKVYNEISKL
jgi:hypothetical protein